MKNIFQILYLLLYRNWASVVPIGSAGEKFLKIEHFHQIFPRSFRVFFHFYLMQGYMRDIFRIYAAFLGYILFILFEVETEIYAAAPFPPHNTTDCWKLIAHKNIPQFVKAYLVYNGTKIICLFCN